MHLFDGFSNLSVRMCTAAQTAASERGQQSGDTGYRVEYASSYNYSVCRRTARYDHDRDADWEKDAQERAT